jgi:alpha-galactosidase
MLALTPPMGWNSWNSFGENVSEQVIKETADAMADSGLTCGLF